MLIGDMAIKNLAPRDANSGGRIIKNMRICGSGLYEYHKSEAALMGLDPEQCPGDTFKVYRPADVLIKNKDLYARVPIITGHHVRVNTENAKQLAVGMVGDTVNYEVGEDGETYLYTTGTIISGDGIDAYENLGQLSVGYDPIVKWETGEHNGVHYDAVLTGFNEVNHLLICRTARGGPQCMIMDSKPSRLEKILNGGKSMGIFNKIFGGGKPLHGDAAVVSTLLQSITAGADPEVQIAKVRGMLGDCKDATFMDYLDELAGAKGEDVKVVQRAVDIVDDYYRKNIVGDEEPGKEPKKPENGDAPDSKPCGDKDPDEPKKDEPKKDEPKKDEPKPSAGDAAIDYDKLATLVAEKLQPKKPEESQNGDAIKELNIAMGGDEKTELTSDTIMANIF